MSCLLLRHGKTKGNLEGRYIGCRTDESLCPEGISQLRSREYPQVRAVYVSPMRRCIETAEIAFPGAEIRVVDDFRECDFGEFENLNYAELNGRGDYQRWIDSGGELPFPGGESKKEFSLRCADAFESLKTLMDGEEIYAFVVHGGTIMAVMEAYAFPRGGYYDFQARNGEGFMLHSGGIYEKWPPVDEARGLNDC